MSQLYWKKHFLNQNDSQLANETLHVVENSPLRTIVECSMEEKQPENTNGYYIAMIAVDGSDVNLPGV